MTITRETLDLSAKAAGLESGVINDQFRIKTNDPSETTCGTYGCAKHCWIPWNPQHDRGQLLDLAMACRVAIDPKRNTITYTVKRGNWSPYEETKEVDCQDFPALAVAVIQAAAEQQLAKEKKE